MTVSSESINTNKVAVITGASSGIGRALALHCGRNNINVIAADINAEALAVLCAELTELGVEAEAQVVDVADAAALERLAEFSYQRFGHVDLLFNNAGVLLSGLSWERSVEDWQWLLNINLFGVINSVNAFMPRMLASGQPAHVVNTASIAGFLASPFLGPYTVSKQALVAYSETLHYDLESIDANVNLSVLCPGPVTTDIGSSGDGRADVPLHSAQIMQAVKEGLNNQISEGMAPEQCAKIVFDAIDRKQFWIFTHDEFKPVFQAKVEKIMNNENPSDSMIA